MKLFEHFKEIGDHCAHWMEGNQVGRKGNMFILCILLLVSQGCSSISRHLPYIALVKSIFDNF
jgi:hypothetical protein